MSGLSRNERTFYDVQFFWFVLVVFFLSLSIRLYGLDRPYFWADEAFSLRISTLPIDQIWSYASHDVHPPFYYYVLNVWSDLLGAGQYQARALSVLFGSMAAVVSACIVRDVATAKDGFFCGLLIAFLPIAVRYSQEARMYALLSFLLMVALWLLIKWVKSPDKKAYLYWYGLFISLSMYTHYFAIFSLLSHWFYLVFISFFCRGNKNYLACPSWWMVNVIAGALYVPWLLKLMDLFSAFDLVSPEGAFSWISRVSWVSAPSIVWSFFSLYDGSEKLEVVYWIPPLLVLLLSIAVIVRDRGKYAFGMLFVSYFFVPLVAVFLISLVVPMWNVRYLAFCSLALPIVAVLALNYSGWRHMYMAVAFFILIQFPGLNNVYQQRDGLNYSRSSLEYPFEPLVKKLNALHVADDDVIVDGGIWYYSVLYYGVSGRQPLLYEQDWVRDPSSRPTGYGLLSLLAPVQDKIFVYDLKKIPSIPKRIWWITSGNKKQASFPANWRSQGTWSFGVLTLLLFNINAVETRQPLVEIGVIH